MQELLNRIDAAGISRCGPRTTRTVFAEFGGYLRVTEHPFQLAARAGLDNDVERPHVYTVARACSAEHHSDGPAYWLAVAEAIRNHCQRRGLSPYVACTWDPRADLKGWFGAQSGGRFISTGGGTKQTNAFDPHMGHAEAARIALDESSNVAAGADKFFSPSGMGGIEASTALLLKWGGEGFQWVGHLSGISTKRLLMLKFRGHGNANNEDAIDFLNGRLPADPEDKTLNHASAALTAGTILGLKGV